MRTRSYPGDKAGQQVRASKPPRLRAPPAGATPPPPPPPALLRYAPAHSEAGAGSMLGRVWAELDGPPRARRRARVQGLHAQDRQARALPGTTAGQESPLWMQLPCTRSEDGKLATRVASNAIVPVLARTARPLLRTPQRPARPQAAVLGPHKPDGCRKAGARTPFAVSTMPGWTACGPLLAGAIAAPQPDPCSRAPMPPPPRAQPAPALITPTRRSALEPLPFLQLRCMLCAQRWPARRSRCALGRRQPMLEKKHLHCAARRAPSACPEHPPSTPLPVTTQAEVGGPSMPFRGGRGARSHARIDSINGMRAGHGPQNPRLEGN
jgi:hypothetical protein